MRGFHWMAARAVAAAMGVSVLAGCVAGAYYESRKGDNQIDAPLETLRQAARDTAEQLVTADWPWRIALDDGDRLVVLHLGQDMFRTELTLTFFDEGGDRSSFSAEGGFKREGALQTQGAPSGDRRAAAARYCAEFVDALTERAQK